MAAFIVVEHLQSRPMLDLSLFRRPAFTGASIVAFTLSSSFFAMFLYLTLYIQDVLGYSPLQAGLRFLPTTLLSFIVAPIAGRLSVRVPVRLLLGSGLVLIGLRPARDDDGRRHLDLDRADPRLRPRRSRRRPGQPAAGLHRDRRGAPRAQRDGLGHQLAPSARSASPRGSPASAPSSSTASPTAPAPRWRPAGRRARSSGAAHGQLGTLLESGEVSHFASPFPRRPHGARTRLPRGFTEAFTTIAIIAAVIALVGAVLRLRAGAQPRLRLRRRAARPAEVRARSGRRRG